MTKPSIIAIDGTAASGKSTIAELLAQSLGYTYVDTGVMYRAVTWATLAQQISVDDEASVSRLAQQIEIDIKLATVSDGRQFTVLVNNYDATWELRTAEVEAHVSKVSSYRGVRQALTQLQRRLAEHGQIIMVGRDIGTIVLPNADLKLFMQASAEERAKRRYKELEVRDEHRDFDEILAAIEERDRLDKQKPISPLVPADDAIVIDTDNRTIPEVLAHIEALMMPD